MDSVLTLLSLEIDILGLGWMPWKKGRQFPCGSNLKINYTRRNAVPTTCQQDVFALLVPSLLTTCYKVVELNRLVTCCSNNLLSSCNSTICEKVVNDNLVAT
jgi:hypothetical protein